jgi:hypothetical protein
MTLRSRTSPRARRILFPVLALLIILFLSFIIHTVILGTSAFPGGKIVDGRYYVEEHGGTIELTHRQYWVSYIHGVVTVSIFGVFFGTVAVLYATGDLKSDDSNG